MISLLILVSVGSASALCDSTSCSMNPNNGSLPVDLRLLGSSTFFAKQKWNGDVTPTMYKWVVHFGCDGTLLMDQYWDNDYFRNSWICEATSVSSGGATLLGQTGDRIRQVEVSIACDPGLPANQIVWPYDGNYFVFVSGGVQDLSYKLEGRSRCACCGGCPSGPPPGPELCLGKAAGQYCVAGPDPGLILLCPSGVQVQCPDYKICHAESESSIACLCGCSGN